MEIQMPTKPNCPSLVWIGSICGIFSFFPPELLLCFHCVELKAPLIKSRSHLLSGWASGSSGWSLQTGSWLFVLLIFLWRAGTHQVVLRTHKNSPVYPQAHFRSFYYWSCFSQGVLFLIFSLP